MINPEMKCQRCGCDNLDILEINHKLGDGGIARKIYGSYNIYWDIIYSGAGEDLEVLCKVCNIVHYVETVLGIKGFTISYQKG